MTFLHANGLIGGRRCDRGRLPRPDRAASARTVASPFNSATARRWRGRLGIPVVYDFRAADVAAGGEGAPLVPVYHRALVRMLDRPQPVAVLNLGGVANVTYVDGDELIAFDIGPGNALIDDFIRLRTGEPHDADGRKAAAGNGRRGGRRASAGASVFRAASAEIARPQ